MISVLRSKLPTRTVHVLSEEVFQGLKESLRSLGNNIIGIREVPNGQASAGVNLHQQSSLHMQRPPSRRLPDRSHCCNTQGLRNSAKASFGDTAQNKWVHQRFIDWLPPQCTILWSETAMLSFVQIKNLLIIMAYLGASIKRIFKGGTQWRWSRMAISASSTLRLVT